MKNKYFKAMRQEVDVERMMLIAVTLCSSGIWFVYMRSSLSTRSTFRYIAGM